MKKLLLTISMLLVCSLIYAITPTVTPTTTPFYQMTVTTNAPNPVTLGQSITIWANIRVIGDFAYGYVFSTYNNVSNVASVPTPSLSLVGSQQWYNNQIINNTNLNDSITITAQVSSVSGSFSMDMYLVDYLSNMYPTNLSVVTLNVVTATRTVTVTKTITPTLTITKTFTVTPTRTLTRTCTSTATITPTITLTNTCSITPTTTATNSETATETVTPTITPTATITPTSTPFITPTIVIEYLSSLQEGFKDAIKVQCNKMNEAGVYTFYYGNYSVSVTETASISPDRIIRIFSNLAYDKSYSMYVSFTASSGAVTYTAGSNVIDVKLAQTPTPSP